MNINFKELYNACGNLSLEYKTSEDVKNIKVIIDEMKEKTSKINEDSEEITIEIKNYLDTQLTKLQEINNKLYEQYGATKNIIIFQARINELRHQYQIPDEQEIIIHADDGEFVQ